LKDFSLSGTVQTFYLIIKDFGIMRKIVSALTLGVACTLLAGCECAKRQEHASMPQAEQVAVVMPVERVSVAGTYHFAFDSDHLTQEDKASLDQIAEVLAANQNTSVSIEGYADARGAAHYNKELGFRRANAVASYLADKGISQQQFAINSYGSDKLLDQSQDSTAHARNRRVEVMFEAESQFS
jgi:outer membrane protein OmpA-like peptidoglycan-associated protein